MKKVFLIFMIMVLGGCVHDVYSHNVEQWRRDSIDVHLVDSCGESCWVENCWRETKEVTVCNVRFSFTSLENKTLALSKASRDLASRGEIVGFCGRDSTMTQFTSSFFAGMGSALVIGVLSGAHGGATFYGVGSDDNRVAVGKDLDNIMGYACATFPDGPSEGGQVATQP